MSHIESPMPLTDIENVLAWVDTFKLSRVTKKINRDFSDAVLLAEILNVHYPKLVEMHNYPPRNSHALKLNNWMTLNKKVLRKLRLGLCCNTMEQLANCTPGVIERVLVMVRDKIRRDEEASRSAKEENTNMSSGGSYYEACGDDDHVLVVPVKTRVNGILETLQQKVVSYELYCTLKQELKDLRDASDLLKQKVDHLDNLMKLKDERIEELQNQLERKQARRKEIEVLQNTLSVPFETVASPHIGNDMNLSMKIPSPQVVDSKSKLEDFKTRLEETKVKLDEYKVKMDESKTRLVDSKTKIEESRIPIAIDSFKMSKLCLTDVNNKVEADISEKNIDTNDEIKQDVFQEIHPVEAFESTIDFEQFKDSEQNNVTNIEDTIQKEIIDINTPEVTNNK